MWPLWTGERRRGVRLDVLIKSNTKHEVGTTFVGLVTLVGVLVAHAILRGQGERFEFILIFFW